MDTPLESEIKALQQELGLFKRQSSKRFGIIELRLSELIKLRDQQGAESLSFSEVEPDETMMAEPAVITPVKPVIAVTVKTPPPVEVIERQPNGLVRCLEALIAAIFNWFSPLIEIYQSYKQRGMLAIFALTVTGIALTLAGFGYLMQLMIDQFDSGAKALTMAMGAFAVMGLGVGLKYKTRFEEFANAIVALGLLLAYSTVHFSGSVYQVLPSSVTLGLFVLVALLCHGFAMWLNTQVIASLGIIGVALMPVFSQNIHLDPSSYLLSVLLVACSSLILAYRKVGHWLANLSLAFVVVACEWVVVENMTTTVIWLLAAFYLLFFAYVGIGLLLNQFKAVSQFKLLAALVGATLLLMFQAEGFAMNSIHYSFAVNGLLAAAMAVVLYKLKHQHTAVMIMLAGLWSVVTVVSLVSDAYWGIAWSVEGLMLIYIGRQYQMLAVVYKGQAVTLVALIYSLMGLGAYFPLPALQSVDGWILSLVIALTLSLWQRMLNLSHLVFDDLSRYKIKPWLQLAEVIWPVVILLACGHIWLGSWVGIWALVVQLAVLFRAKQTQLASIEWLAVALAAVPVAVLYQTFVELGWVKFSLLPWFAKLAVLSLLGQMWLWSGFYRRFYPQAKLLPLAEKVRTGFYLALPLIWVGSAVRHLAQDVLMLLWLSPLLALYLANKIKHEVLVSEFMLTMVLSSCALILAIGSLSLLAGQLALSGFTLLYCMTYYYYKYRGYRKIGSFGCNCALITMGLTLPIFIGVQSADVIIGLIAAAVYWATAFHLTKLSLLCQRSRQLIELMNLAVLASGWWMSLFFIHGVLIVMASLFIPMLLNRLSHANLAVSQRLPVTFNHPLGFHGVWVISYICCLGGAYDLNLLIAPLLALHGVLLLFSGERHKSRVQLSFGLMLVGIAKLALIDAAHALLWQKVLLFMGIGVFILFASFGYQKLVVKE